jgi:hypothetical protein
MLRVVLASVSLTLLLAVAASSSNRVVSATGVRAGCPSRFDGRTQARTSLVDQAITAARRIAVDNVVEHNQGRTSPRTRTNYPVLNAIQLRTFPVLPGQQTLIALVSRRCGRTTAKWTQWAITFTDTQSVLCCIRDVRFVIKLDDGWWVY